MAEFPGYGQLCPMALAAEIVAERWTPLVIREVLLGSRRFNDIRRGVPLMSPTILAQRLRKLERAGIVRRRNADGRIEYRPTEAGQALQPVILSLADWGRRFVRTRVRPGDVDVAHLMWEIRRKIVARALPPRRVLVHFLLRDAAAAKRSWWILVAGGEVELCLQHPGYEVDASVETDVATLTRLWLGEIDAASALASGRIRIEGAPAIARSFPRWIGSPPALRTAPCR
ncbi:MAG: transcriptional regulator [Planctomycetes bacterium]|nr:transcriptional regulator [Planctomycetota bacterium]